MPIIITILGALAAVYFFMLRARNAKDMAQDVLSTADDVLTTVLNAPRRIRFRRQTNQHPVEGVNDPRLAVAALAEAFIELDDLPTAEQRKMLLVQLRSVLRADQVEAEEMAVLGRWLVAQCNGASEAVTRIGRRLYKLDQGQSIEQLTEILRNITGEQGLSDRQREALEDISRVLKVG